MSRIWPPPASTGTVAVHAPPGTRPGRAAGAGAAADHRTQPPMRCPHRVRRCCRPPAAPRAVHRCCAGHCVPAATPAVRPRPPVPRRRHWPTATAGGGAVRSGATLRDQPSALAARPAPLARRHPSPARRPAAGARPAHGRVGLQPALQGSLLTFRQRACTAPDHPAQRLPGLTRRGFGRVHGCGLPHHERVRLPVVTTAGAICPRQSQLINALPADAAGSTAPPAAHSCRPALGNTQPAAISRSLRPR